jgi:hypothetical protein
MVARRALIAFQNYSPEGTYAIWIVRPDGSGLQALTDGPSMIASRRFPTRPRSPSPRSQQRQAVQDLTVTLGGQLGQITTGTGAESNPIVSPTARQSFVNNATIFRYRRWRHADVGRRGNFPT